MSDAIPTAFTFHRHTGSCSASPFPSSGLPTAPIPLRGMIRLETNLVGKNEGELELSVVSGLDVGVTAARNAGDSDLAGSSAKRRCEADSGHFSYTW